jgi:hypothetical protein
VSRSLWLVIMWSSRLLSTRAPEQDDPKKERYDEWDGRDSDNKTGTGVPWRRESFRVRILDPSDQEEQQRDPFTIMNARVALRPSHWTRPREAANATVAR